MKLPAPRTRLLLDGLDRVTAAIPLRVVLARQLRVTMRLFASPLLVPAASLALLGALPACGAPQSTRPPPPAPEEASSDRSPHEGSGAAAVNQPSPPAPKPGPGDPCSPGQDLANGSPGDCQEGLLCCTNFHGSCGGAQPLPGEAREPCTTTYRCAAVERCWGPPP